MTGPKILCVVYGWGGSIFDPADGEVEMLALGKAAGFIVPDTPFQYDDANGIANFLSQGAAFRALVGDSFGADYEANYADSVHRLKIDIGVGFQPSMYANDVRNGVITIPTNIKLAHCFRNPVWIETLGLGYARYVAADPKMTVVMETDIQAPHPDDDGIAQQLAFAQIKHLAGV